MAKLKAIVALLSFVLVSGLVWRIVERQARAAKLDEDVQTRMRKIAAAPLAAPSKQTASEVARPALVTAKDGVYFSGELRPVSEADLAFKTGGRLARILVAQGEWVKEGQALLQLEDREAQAQLKQARAAVEAAKAQASMAQDADKRVKALGEKSALSDQQKSTVGDQARLAMAGQWQAEAMLELAELNLGNHTLRAPFAGRITRVPAGVGTIVGPGLPLLGLVDTSHWKVIATASLDDGGKLKTGDSVEFSIAHLKDGKVKHISPSLQERSRRVVFEIAATPTDAAPLFAGQIVNGQVLVHP